MKFLVAVLVLFACDALRPKYKQTRPMFQKRLFDETHYETEFKQFGIRHGKKYSVAEFFARYDIFKNNLDKIERHNNAGHSWKMGVTQFADLTADEFGEFVKTQGGGGFRPSNRTRNVVNVQDCTDDSVDWVAKGAVTPVKNQGQCGSCWAFSTTGSTEGRYFVKTGELNSLSEQQLVDCDYSLSGNHGCQGGEMDMGFEYIQKNGGLCSEADYPYTAKHHFFDCKASSCQKHNPVTGHVDVKSRDSAAMKAAVCEGPVSIAIEADQNAFQLYKSGVMDSSCGTQLDHGVLLVGYGTDGEKDFWKVKNSWGESWGESGYIRMCRNCNKNNGSGQCGLLMQGSYPTV